jgi:hypothetical protein
VSYWDNESYSDSEADNDDPVSSYDDLFGFNDDEPEHPLDEHGVDFGSPNCRMDEAGMVGHDDVDSKLQLTQIQIGNEDSKVQSAEMVSELVGGLTETDSMKAADNGDVKLQATAIDLQAVGELTESQLVTAEEYNSNLNPVAMESVGIDGRQN